MELLSLGARSTVAWGGNERNQRESRPQSQVERAAVTYLDGELSDCRDSVVEATGDVREDLVIDCGWQ